MLRKMRKVRAMVMIAPKHLELQNFPYPEVQENALVASVRIGALCGSDHQAWSGHLTSGEVATLPVIRGHEVVGEVDEIGEKARYKIEANGNVLGDGDRITWCPIVPCGECWYCRWLADNIRGGICDNLEVYGCSISSRSPPHLFGAFAEYVYIKPKTCVYKLPEDLPDKVAVLLDTLASVNGIDRAVSPLPWAREGFMWGDTAVVQGAGPIGVMAALKLKEYGASKVIMIGGPEERLRLAKKFGVDDTINLDEISEHKARVEEVKELTDGRGADIVVEGAGVPAAFAEAPDLVRKAGIVVEIGCAAPGLGTVQIDPYTWQRRDLTLICQCNYSPHQYKRDLQMLHKWHIVNKYPLEELVTHEFKLEDLEEAIKTHKAWKSMKCIVRP